MGIAHHPRINMTMMNQVINPQTAKQLPADYYRRCATFYTARYTISTFAVSF